MGGEGMPQVQLTVPGYECTRCTYQWIPRTERKPTICPRCKSPYWDKEPMRARKEVRREEPSASEK
jgi:predicted Zn-ribbon and HTH transcriptional regulator